MIELRREQQTFEDFVLSVVGNCLIEHSKSGGGAEEDLAKSVTQALLKSQEILKKAVS